MNLFGKFLTLLGAEPTADDAFWYRPVNAPFGSYLAQFAGGESAMRINAVAACVTLRSETIASLPCQVFRRTADGREVYRDHPLYYLLHDSPNDDISAFEFWQACEQSLCIDGNFYARIETNARNEASALYPMNAECMTVQRDKQTGILVYTYNEGGESRPYVRDEILHIPGNGYDGVKRLKGMSPIAQMRQSLEIAASAEAYGANFFRNNAAPHAYITHPSALSDTAKKGILDYMMDKFGGVRNAGKLGILEEGMEIKTVPINHVDMQYLELRNLQVIDIARAYRVPPHKIGELTRSTNNNIEHQGIEWKTDTIGPECGRIEKRCNMQLLGPREAGRLFIEFNLDGLLRGDAASRAEYYAKMFNTASISPDEIRAKENMNKIPGGDRYYLNGTMIPAEMAGEQYKQPDKQEQVK